jgi:TM2 domain-containing membrane protein YozV
MFSVPVSGCAAKRKELFFVKNPGLAAVLSFFITGLGQIYNGQIGKGIALFAGAVVSGLLCAVVIGFVLLPVIWLYGIFDAYRTAEKINRGAGEGAEGYAGR